MLPEEELQRKKARFFAELGSAPPPRAEVARSAVRDSPPRAFDGLLWAVLAVARCAAPGAWPALPILALGGAAG